MKKLKILFVSVAVMLIAVAFSVTVYAQDDVYTNGVYTYTVTDGKATIVGVEGVTTRHIVIPDNLDGYPVVRIGEKALYHDRIREITFPATLEHLERNPFSWLVNNIHISSIENWVKVKFDDGYPYFSNIKNLYLNDEVITDLVIPEGVTEIGAYSFFQLKSIETVTIPASVKKIGNYAFGFTELEAVYVESIEAWINTCAAMENVNHGIWHPMTDAEKLYVGGELLVDLVIPESVTEIPARTFYGVDSIENITFHSGITRVGDSAFSNCTYVKNLYLPDMETWLNFDLNFKNKNRRYENIYFSGELANELVIPEDVTELPEYAFAKWAGLKSVTFPESLKTIGENAFVDCGAVESVYAPSLEYWVSIDFASAEANPLCAVSKLYLGGEVLENLQMPEGITEIKKYAFSGYAVLKSFTVTGEAVSVGSGAFKGSSNMTVYADCVEDWFNVKFLTQNANPLCYGAVLFINGEKCTEITIPEDISKIPDYAFCGYKELKRMSIPATTDIGLFAFYESGLEEIVLGSLIKETEPTRDVTLATFNDCTNLEKITFGYGVRSIGANSFNGRTSLKEVYFYSGIERIEEYAFYKTGINEVVIPSSVKHVGKSAFEKCKSLKSVTLGDMLADGDSTYIYQRAFAECSSLDTVNFNSGIRCVEEDAFLNAKALEFININDLYSYLSIDFVYSNPTKYTKNIYVDGEPVKNLVIPEGIRGICRGAFYNCKTLETVSFPSTLLGIGDYAFGKCTNLKNFALPESVNSICGGAFYGCDSITQAELPGNLVFIGGSAFGRCRNLKLVYMYPETLEIGKHAFDGCSNIKLMLYTGTEQAWNRLIRENKETGLDEIPVFFSYRPESMYAPEEVYAQQTDDSVTLEWSQINGVSGYRVFIKTDSGWKALETVKNNNLEVMGLASGTKYTFAVKAYVNTGALVLWSPNYATVNTATTTEKPSKVTAQQNTSAIRLTWTACDGATGYRIYYKSAGKWKVAVSTTAVSTHTFKNLKAGAKYTFAIRPYIKNGGTVIWSPYTEFMTATKPDTVAVKADSPSKGKVNLTWNAVKGADGYQIWYKVGDGSFKRYKTLGATTGIGITGVKAGKYTFAVRAGIKTSGGNIFGGYKEYTVTVK